MEETQVEKTDSTEDSENRRKASRVSRIGSTVSSGFARLRSWLTGKDEHDKDAKVQEQNVRPDEDPLGGVKNSEQLLNPNTKKILDESDIDPNREQQVRTKTAEVLKNDEDKFRNQLGLVTGVLNQMERIHAKEVEQEDEQLAAMKEEHEKYKKHCFELISALKAKERELMEQLEKFDAQVVKLESELEADKCKRHEISKAYEEISKAVRSQIRILQQESKRHQKLMKEFDAQIEKRRWTASEDIRRYQTAKRNLEVMINERSVVRQFLEGRSHALSEAPDKKAIAKVAHQEMNDMKGLTVVESKEMVKDKGYTFTVNLVQKTLYYDMYCVKKADAEGKEIMLNGVIITFALVDQAFRSHLVKEGLKILTYLHKRPFIHLVKIHDVFLVNDEKLILMQDVFVDDLGTVVNKIGPMSEIDARLYSYSVVKAIDYLHTRGIAHQNIAPRHVYFHTSGVVKLGYLEHTTLYWNAEGDRILMKKNDPNVNHGKCTAPEIIAGLEYNPAAVDVYSLGVIVCYMLLGHYPYEKQVFVDESEQWKVSKVELSSKCAPPCMDLIKQLMETDPEKRIRIGPCLTHSWYTLGP